jgi:hypothetical protein
MVPVLSTCPPAWFWWTSRAKQREERKGRSSVPQKVNCVYDWTPDAVFPQVGHRRRWMPRGKVSVGAPDCDACPLGNFTAAVAMLA